MLTPPITSPLSGGVDWNSVYEKIGIELVFETSENAEATMITEKLLRPMLFKRPFMLIGGKHAIKTIKEVVIPKLIHPYDSSINICFFDEVISNAYDNDHGIHRVEHVFDILRELILTNKIHTIIDDCRDGIETNYKYVQTVLHNKYSNIDKQSSIFDFESWKKPSF
jgi:hypothetical protein